MVMIDIFLLTTESLSRRYYNLTDEHDETATRFVLNPLTMNL